MEELVLVEKADGYGVVTLNRPKAMNALSAELRNHLAAAIDDLEADNDIRVMILTGAGDKAFTAGLDLKEMGAQQGGGPALAIASDDPVVALDKFSGPIIGAINGVAITPLADTIQLGQEMIQFRARYTAEAIRRALSTVN